VDSLTSNIGHLLGTGLLNAEEELLVARRVAGPALDSGLGLRTMSCDDAGYSPLSYHCGSVWPHDTAIVLAGLARAGLADHAGGLVEGLLRASVAFDQRLPELWSGEGRAVPYPASCRPQAWSAAAAVVVAQVLG
jgi:glycogen debranching enzyme